MSYSPRTRALNRFCTYRVDHMAAQYVDNLDKFYVDEFEGSIKCGVARMSPYFGGQTFSFGYNNSYSRRFHPDTTAVLLNKPVKILRESLCLGDDYGLYIIGHKSEHTTELILVASVCFTGRKHGTAELLSVQKQKLKYDFILRDGIDYLSQLSAGLEHLIERSRTANISQDFGLNSSGYGTIFSRCDDHAPVEFHIDTALPSPTDTAFDELDWVNDMMYSDVGSSSMITTTLQALQNRGYMVVIEPEYYTNYNGVAQNNNMMIQHVSQVELHAANHSTDPDAIYISSSTAQAGVNLHRKNISGFRKMIYSYIERLKNLISRDTGLQYLDDNIAFNELERLNGTVHTDVGPSSMIPTTLQASHKEIYTMQLEPEHRTNYNVVEHNNMMIQHISQDEFHVAEDSTCPDTICISSRTTRASVNNYRTTTISISLNAIEQLFGMSIMDAAKILNVSVSTLKRICRGYDIKRWPNCRKRKTINHKPIPNPKNVNKLVEINNKDLTDQSTRKIILSHCEEASSHDVTIKAAYGDDIVKFSFSVSLGLGDLKEKICKRLDLNIPVKLKYTDDDGDVLFIGCNDTLQEIFGNQDR